MLLGAGILLEAFISLPDDTSRITTFWPGLAPMSLMLSSFALSTRGTVLTR